ncbi:MAG: hypothetical protein FWD75_07685 [Propionibacteriaceae bacterium]|nr:hypothetical protein [Propionibacteriaceae bacterium]
MRKVATLMAILLSGAIALAGVQPAQAYTDRKGVFQADNEKESMAVTIKASLIMDPFTDAPQASFVFDVTPVSVDGLPVDLATSQMPVLGPVDLDIAQMRCIYTCGPDGIHYPYKSWWGQTRDILDGVSFPHAGTYVYTISERPDAGSVIEGDPDHEKVKCDTSHYTLTMNVANSSTGGLYVHSMTAEGWPENESWAGLKTDPTPQEERCGGSCTPAMEFTNYYVHTNGAVDPHDPDPVHESTLSVSTSVGGTFANRQQYFTYSLHCRFETFHWDVPDYYRGYVVEDGKVIDPVDNADASDIGVDDTGNGYAYVKVFAFSIGDTKPYEPTTVKLKHGQKIQLVDLPVGASCLAWQQEPSSGYAASVDVIVDGKLLRHSDDDPYTWGGVGEGENAVNFTFVRDAITATGLDSRTAPFAGLIVLVVLASVVLVVGFARSRRRAVR